MNEIKGIGGKIKEHEVQIKQLNWLMGVVIIVLLMGFLTLFGVVITLVWNSHLWGANTYQSLIKELDKNNDEAILLSNKINEFQIELNQTNTDLIKLKAYFGIK